MKVEQTKIYAVILEVFKDDNKKMNEIVRNLEYFIKTNEEGFSDNQHIYLCFTWEDSVQGRDYWCKVDSTIDNYMRMKEEKYMTTTKEPEQNIISMDKQYTRNGKKVRVLCVDRQCDKYPVVALIEGVCVEYFTANGQFHYDYFNDSDSLKEYNPWQDVAVDTKVYVKFFSEQESEVKRHFSHYANGRIYIFVNGDTSFTTDASPERVYSARLA